MLRLLSHQENKNFITEGFGLKFRAKRAKMKNMTPARDLLGHYVAVESGT